MPTGASLIGFFTIGLLQVKEVASVISGITLLTPYPAGVHGFIVQVAVTTFLLCELVGSFRDVEYREEESDCN